MELIVKSKLKEQVKELGFNLSSTSIERLNELVFEIIKSGCERADSNNRKTLQSKDL